MYSHRHIGIHASDAAVRAGWLAAAGLPALGQVASPRNAHDHLHHHLHFAALAPEQHALDIPCDAQGDVPLNGLGEHLRNDYFFARALIGRLFAAPTVESDAPPPAGASFAA